MANAYSIIHNYDRPTYTPAFDFIQAALSSKQGAYNVNTDKIQNLYDQFAVLDVKKDVDQEYIKSRLEQVKNITNQYQSMDFSDRNFNNSVMSNVSQVLDDKVKEAIYSTKRIQAEDAVWAEKRKKGDGSYAEVNEAYAKAMSDRNRYLTSEEAGDTYRGGADFIAYKDISKKFMDNIPKIQDALKATWIQTGPSSGYFRSISTMEAVNRSDMEGVLHSLIDEGDKKQMRINAWSSYDRADDSDIKDDYDSFYQERVSTADEKIKSIELLLAKDPNNEEYKSALDSWKTRRETLAENTFDNAVKSGGRESAYSNLYADRFFDNYLDAYSYEPREIKREIDQVQKANIEFAETLRSHRADESLARDKFDWQKEIDVANLEVKRAAAGLSDKTGNENVSYSDYVDKGKGIDQKETALDGAGYINKEKASARRGLESLVGAPIKLGDYANISKTLANLENKIANGETIKIKGKAIDLSDPSNVAKVLNFKKQMMGKTSFEKQYKEQIDNRVDNLVDQLQDYVGNNYDLKNLPKFNFQIKNGRVIKRSSSDKNYYAMLLYKSKNSKDGLTDEEEANLKMYTSMHLAVDPKSTLSKDQNEMLFSNIREKYLKGVPAEDFDKIPINAREAKQAFSSKEKGGALIVVPLDKNNKFFKDQLNKIYGGNLPFDKYTNAVTGISEGERTLINKLGKLYNQHASTKDIEEKKVIYSDIRETKKRLQKVANSITLESGSGMDKHYISDLSLYWNSANNIGKSGEDILKNIKTSFESIDQDVIEDNKSILPGKIGIGKGDPRYDGLKAFAQNTGAIGSDYKGSILITPVNMKQDGTYSKVKISGTYSTEKGGLKNIKEYAGIEISVSDMEGQIPGFSLKTLERTPYDISLKAPEELSLGRSSSKYNPNAGDVLWEYSDKLIDAYGDRAAKIIPLYKSGKLDFKLVPSKSGYMVNMYVVGNPEPIGKPVLYADQQTGKPVTKLYTEDVVKAIQISNELKSSIVQQYITNE